MIRALVMTRSWAARFRTLPKLQEKTRKAKASILFIPVSNGMLLNSSTTSSRLAFEVLAGAAVHEEPHIGSPHFFPTLVTVVDPLAGIRVVLVVRRIVIAKFDVHPGALRYLQRGSVGELPIKIVMGNVEHNFFSSIRISQLILHTRRAHMRVGTEPYELNILEEGDFRRRPKIALFIWRNRKFADGVSPHKRRTLTIFPILRDESLRRWYLRHCESNSCPIDERHTVRRVMQAHHDIRSSRHENSGVHRAIVFVGQPRQIAKLVATTYSLDARTARFLGAAHFPPDDDPFLCVHAP